MPVGDYAPYEGTPTSNFDAEMDYSEVRAPFQGLENIKRHYGQIFQDIFVLCMTEGKCGGIFLEIGGFHSEGCSNTCLLEREFGWEGVTIEIDPERAAEIAENRKCIVLTTDALKADYKWIKEAYTGADVDYLQVDCEPATTSLEALRLVLEGGIRAKIVTFEHDQYAAGDEVMIAARELLAAYGYELLVSNVGIGYDTPFEDWFVLPGAFSGEIKDKMRSLPEGDVSQPVMTYLFPGEE